MFSVALIGPDGCGKSTISKRLLQDASFKSKRIYMGVDRDESNYALPTTHLIRWLKRKLKAGQDQGGPRDISNERKQPGSSVPKRLLKQLTTAFVFFNNTAEEWYRQLLTWYFIHSGYIVIFDRHFYADFYHFHVNGRDDRWTSRLHGYMLEHLFPKPDLVIYLDAPAEVLFARKKEGTIELLEERRHDYLELQEKVPHFAIVDVTQTQDEVFTDVRQLILRFLQTKNTNG
jgi:thymidylate kinase